jgi:hypothetical protein
MKDIDVPPLVDEAITMELQVLKQQITPTKAHNKMMQAKLGAPFQDMEATKKA